MPDISKIKLPSGTEYNIKDETARQMATGAIINRGKSITAITDFATTNPINLAELTITDPSDWSTDYTSYYTYNATTHIFEAVPAGSGAPEWVENTYYEAKSRNCVSNDAVFYGKSEFVFDGTYWNEFGNTVGGVTSVTAGSGLQVGSSGTGTSITDNGTINHVNSVTAQSTAALKKITFDDTGHVTGVDNPSTDTITPVTSNTVVTDVGVSAASATSATGELVYCSVANETLTLSKFVKTTGDSVTAGNAKTFVTNS